MANRDSSNPLPVPASAEFADNRLRADRDELAWLSQLPGCVVPRSDETTVESVAERILPRLRILVRARLLLLLEQKAAPSGCHPRPGLLWSDGDSLSPAVCERIISRHAAQALAVDGVCLNFLTPDRAAESRDGVLSAILVPVRWPGRPEGWLAAINKDLRPLATGIASGRYGVDIQSADVEFGDAEFSLMSAAASALATNDGILKLLQEREQLLTGVVRSLVNALDAKDAYTCGHSDRVAEFARLTAEAMGGSAQECEQIHMAGLLHDIGKVGIPEQLLNKPSPVTEEEMETIRQHPVTGYEILQHLNSFEYVLPGVLHHHESFDGTGYPHQLSGESIPLTARILAVADAWDAMTSDRPYRVGMPVDQATSILQNDRGRQWDPACVDAFLQCMDAIRVRMDHAHSETAAPWMIQRTAVASLSGWPQPAESPLSRMG